MYYYTPRLQGRERGLNLHVSPRHLKGHPRYRAHGLRHSASSFMRFDSGDQPLFWSCIDSYWEDFAVLKNTFYQGYSSVLPSLTSRVVEQCVLEQERLCKTQGEDEQSAWFTAWERYFAKTLGTTDVHRNILWEGEWSLAATTRYDTRLRVWSREALGDYMQALTSPAYHVYNMDLAFPWPTRVSSLEDSARVKWYRKLQMQERLPPVLCMWVRPFDAAIIIDGHDRMLAALLNNITPPIVMLEPWTRIRLADDVRAAWIERVEHNYSNMRPHLHRMSEGSIETINRDVMAAYGVTDYAATMRVWPYEGGAIRWRVEVGAHMNQLTDEFSQIARLVQQGFE